MVRGHRPSLFAWMAGVITFIVVFLYLLVQI